MKRIVLLGGLCLTCVALLMGFARERNSAQSTVELFSMDTPITMTAWGKGSEAALAEAKGKQVELEQLWSVTDPDSDVYAVNHSGGRAVDVSPKRRSCSPSPCRLRRTPAARWSRRFTRF